MHSNKTLIVDINKYLQFTNETLSIEMIPSPDRLEDSKKFDAKMLEIRSWDMEGSTNGDGIAKIQLNFTHPQQISQGLE